MATIILDCYTDEPAGLGVPPYLGTYPRYIAGWLKHQNEKFEYLTIDDLRLLKFYGGKKIEAKENEKTNIRVYNTTRSAEETSAILENAESLIAITGVHTPGKYLSAIPGTIKEVVELLEGVSCEKILTGPALYGTSVEGGRKAEKIRSDVFDKKNEFNFTYDEIREYSVLGAEILRQIPALRVIELETGRGCPRKKGCSFCTEPLKNRLEFRKAEDILSEMKALSKLGAEHFRLGKQSCFYSYPEPAKLLESARSQNQSIKTLHIDNVNPAMVISEKGAEITKSIVKYCTPGNIASFGAETFDSEVCEKNNLNSNAETTFEAVRLINKYGAERSENGMPFFLPGINLLFGLNGESKNTHAQNMLWLKKILDEGLLLRRINIRQVNVFEGTELFNTVGTKFLRKNKKYYWKWRDQIRHEIDLPMLKRLVPAGTVLKSAMAEIYDGKTTFARQLGTYPLIVGVQGRVPLGKFYDIEVTGHMLRSITGKIKSY